MVTKKAASFIDLLDIEIDDPNSEPSMTAIATIKIDEHHGQYYDVLHGGVLYSLADTLAGYLVWKNVSSTSLVTTIEMKINYISAVPIKGSVKAQAEIKHLGRRTGVVNVDVLHVFGDKEKLVATALGTFQIIDKS